MSLGLLPTTGRYASPNSLLRTTPSIPQMRIWPPANRILCRDFGPYAEGPVLLVRFQSSFFPSIRFEGAGKTTFSALLSSLFSPDRYGAKAVSFRVLLPECKTCT